MLFFQCYQIFRTIIGGGDKNKSKNENKKRQKLRIVGTIKNIESNNYLNLQSLIDHFKMKEYIKLV